MDGVRFRRKVALESLCGIVKITANFDCVRIWIIDRTWRLCNESNRKLAAGPQAFSVKANRVIGFVVVEAVIAIFCAVSIPNTGISWAVWRVVIYFTATACCAIAS